MDLILDVDTQNDFMKPDGALYVQGAKEIIPNIKKLLSRMYLPIISTVDEHERDDKEFETFPKHCVIGSFGSLKISDTMVYDQNFVSYADKDGFTDKQINNSKQFIVAKKTYNVWDEELGNPTAMDHVLAYFNPDTVHVIGVASEICVLAGVIGLAKRVQSIVLHTDCMKGLTEEAEQKAISEMVAIGNVWLEA